MEDGMVYVRSQRVYVRSHTFHKKYRKTLSFRNPQIRSSNLIMSLRFHVIRDPADLMIFFQRNKKDEGRGTNVEDDFIATE
jgi:hypothetical protein